MQSQTDSLDPYSSYFTVDDLLEDQECDDLLYFHCCMILILISAVVAALLFIEYYDVHKLCYKYIHPDMQAFGDFRDHSHQTYTMPIC